MDRKFANVCVRVGGGLLLALSTAGCTQEIGSSEPLGQEEGELYLDGNTWPNATVNVCLDPVDGINLTLVAEAQRQLAASWSRAANIRFLGWGTCNLNPGPNGNFSAIRLHFCGGSSTSSNCPVAFYDNSVRSVGGFRGYSAYGRIQPTGSTGNFTPGVNDLALISDDTQSFLTRFRYQVVHEFGHALGYRHEQDRPDNFNGSGGTIFCSQSASQATTGSNQTPFFDLDSIMNYCARDPITGGVFPTMLSNGDVLGVRLQYGRNSLLHGFMIRSDQNSSLAVNAWGGAAEGTALRLHSGCNLFNPDCTWSYYRGMIVSDKDPSLAINAWGGAVEGATLRLTRLCTPSNPDCTWTYKKGEFRSDRNNALAINAWLGAVHGATLVTTGLCTASNPDCTWAMQNVMLSSHRDPSLAVNAIGGAANNVALGLHNACVSSNPNCTFTFTKGMLVSSANTTLAMNAVGGAVNGQRIEINNLCAATNPDCTWTWNKGRLISDNTTNGTLPVTAVGGGIHGQLLKLSSSCGTTNPDCFYTGRFAHD